MAKQKRDNISKTFLLLATHGTNVMSAQLVSTTRNTWNQRNERPTVGGVSIRSRNGAPSRKGYVTVKRQTTKASKKKSTPPLPPPPTLCSRECRPSKGLQRKRSSRGDGVLERGHLRSFTGKLQVSVGVHGCRVSATGLSERMLRAGDVCHPWPGIERRRCFRVAVVVLLD